MPADAKQWSPTQVRILRATAELIAKQGYSATSTRDIAAAVGVEQPALYKHFSAKGDIFAAIVRLALEWPVQLADELAALPVPAAVKLHRFLRESLNHLHASPEVVVSVIATPDLWQDRFAAEQELAAKLERALAELIETAQAEGDVRAINPLSASRLLQALFDALTPQLTVSPDEILEFGLVALLAEPARLAEIRSAADALNLQTTPPINRI
ncbi:TetR/AcrR family transcriptional regulator [Mycobacterium shigaense]|uniref:TetR family transcriptional regulator n=1 Tax=Mycobacterium shigaense TaxID=722731 RepID=A0A1Z4EGK4_9MYCO|nr:TetR/AcrR family transcriptional regulator [Mycobacterium shigaense]MEA1123908.1 helix-turn-helix domain-containing protein [Mycobacterium shigaense]PRI16746.1 TetR family transcriptional regulator [Mycobacterium shigaense]BAX92056.1 TetR family transcriptional regulator [Mycobacterium shigaense]